MSPVATLLHLQGYIFYPEEKGSKLHQNISKFLSEYNASLVMGEYSSFCERDKLQSYASRSGH